MIENLNKTIDTAAPYVYFIGNSTTIHERQMVI